MATLNIKNFPDGLHQNRRGHPCRRRTQLMGLMEDVGSGPIGLDTAIFIYYIEENPRYLPLVAPLLEPLVLEALER